MSEFLFSSLGFHGSGPLAVLREFVQWVLQTLGPLVEWIKPFWDQFVTMLSRFHEELSNRFEEDQDRASWGKPELGWES